MPLAACVVLMESERVLLARENYGARRWGFPGGRVEPGEASFDAAVREALEETGLVVTLTGLIGQLKWIDGGENWTAEVFSGEITQGTAQIQDEDEIAEIAWFPLAGLPEPLTRTAAAWTSNGLLA